jgi:hypothetical protein
MGDSRMRFDPHHNCWIRGAVLLMLVLSMTACRGRGQTLDDIPTLIPNVDALSTSVAQTETAPPEGYRETVSYETVDNNLRDLDGWHYRVQLGFDGVFSQTDRVTSATAAATVYGNQIASSRRVIVESDGELLQQPEGASFEAVRLGPDAFLVRNGVCLSNAEDAAMTATNISAGALVGGARNATPTGRREVVNGFTAWEYRIDLEQTNLPAVRFAEDTEITAMAAEMWVAPEIDAVVRYYVTLDLQNARLLLNDLPVSGQLRLRYDLLEANTQPNITVPFGC